MICPECGSPMMHERAEERCAETGIGETPERWSCPCGHQETGQTPSERRAERQDAETHDDRRHA